jgi:hypothetical protein
MSNSEIRRRLAQGGDAVQAKDLLRRSFDHHRAEERERREQQERIRAERVRRIWEDTANSDSREEA